MCGRYSLTADPEELARRFEFAGDWTVLKPRYNVAPTQQVLAVVGGAERRGGLMRWGLIPHWAKQRKSGRPLINARAETVAERPAFRAAFRRRRCLILADGFYEWQPTGGVKRPMRIVLDSEEPFAFAGLWSVWIDPEGQRISSCAIITTKANDLLRPIHDRMPVILARDDEEFWLDPDVDDPGTLGSLLTPYDARAMEAYEVSPLVNAAANDGPEIIARVA
ncbi:MAG: SOS response-associated peptidase [Chloroflexi bacterium]|nr:SOS response-associated peptidase [Chloroflexota bacterium]MYC02948.1 SOS response-associated peptidase [Chloroflexota bacterium]